MEPRSLFASAMVAASPAFLTPPAHATCEMESGPRTAALVELYTSEGCSSCPPADQQLRKLREALDPGADVVPLSLHVTYWNYIGWIDPFAQRAFDERQRWLVRVNGQRTLYTPQFFVGGTELRSVRAGLREQVRRVNGMPAAAAVRLHAQVLPGQRLALHASASARPGDSLALHVAIAESGLVSRVTRGENADATLEHDHVVRAWIGPVPLGPEGASIRRDVSLAPGWKHENLEIAAFVQHERTGRVLQAVGGHCAG